MSPLKDSYPHMLFLTWASEVWTMTTRRVGTFLRVDWWCFGLRNQGFGRWKVWFLRVRAEELNGHIIRKRIHSRPRNSKKNLPLAPKIPKVNGFVMEDSVLGTERLSGDNVFGGGEAPADL